MTALALPLRLALAALCLALPGPLAAQDRPDPSFREAPAGGGGTRLRPTCRVQGIVSGGIINFASPELVAIQRGEKLRGVATRLVTLAPVSTDLVLMLAAPGDGTDADLEARRAAIAAAFAAAGLTVTASELGPVEPPRQNLPAHRRQVLFRLAGDVDPLAAMALLPPGLAEALVRLQHAFPPAAAVIDPLRAGLEQAARSDAGARAAGRGEGAALGQRTDLSFADRSPGFPDPRSGRWSVEASAVATYLLSRPPGARPE